MTRNRPVFVSAFAAAACAIALFAGANQSPTPVAPPLPVRPPSPAPQPEREAREALAQFYTALNALFTGEMKLMNDVWSHADDVTYMGPAGGMQVGWKGVSGELGRQAAMKMGGKIEPSDIHFVVIGGALAIVSNYEKGENFDAAGNKSTVSIRVTSSFRCEGGAWKMIGHHTDLLPMLAK